MTCHSVSELFGLRSGGASQTIAAKLDAERVKTKQGRH